MPLSRFLIRAGVMFFSAVAMFTGGAVIANALTTGEIRYSHGSGAETITRTARCAEEPDAYWRTLTLLGGLPFVLGAGGLWLGRRMGHEA